MAKKAESTDITKLSFFECQNFIEQVNKLAAENDGEISEEQVDALIEAQTQSPAKLHSLCNFLKLMESNIKICEERKQEINEVQKHAESVVARMESRLAKFVEKQGKSYHAGEYHLTTRKSKSVEYAPDFFDPFYCTVKMKRQVIKDTKAVKKDLIEGKKIDGAILHEKVNLTIK